jgi:predicted dehydrogenase
MGSAIPRVAVIGVGGFGAEHVREYLAQGAEVVAVADIDGRRAQEVADRHGIAAVFADGLQLLDECAIDGVSIATTPAHQPELARAAASRGVRVLLEKPVASSAAEGHALLDAVSPGMVLPGHVLRFDPFYRRLRAGVAAGQIGEVLAISARRDRPCWHSVRYAGVHPALLTCVHDIDLAVAVTGARATRVSAHSGRGGADLLFAQVEADDGSVWSLRTSWLLPEEDDPSDRFEVYGAAGLGVVEVGRGQVELSLGSPHEVTDRAPAEAAPGLAAEIEHFCACLREDRPSDVVTLAEAVHVVAIAEAMIASAAQGGEFVEVGD